MSLTSLASTDIRSFSEKIVTSTWTDNTNNLTQLYSSSIANFNSPTSSKWFYIEALNKVTTDTTAEVQFACAYGHRNGSGSPDFTNDTGSFGYGASRTVYGQYRQLVYGDEEQPFTFGSHVPDDIYVININRSRYKNSLALGSLSLHLSGASDPASDTHVLYLTDDSVSSNGVSRTSLIGREFNIVSGASGQYSGSSANQVGGSGSYGLFYPDAGLIILNGDAFQTNDAGATSSLSPWRNPAISTNVDKNTDKIYHAIQGGNHFILDSEEIISSKYFFVRAKNHEYNYTTNPSFTDSTGNLLFSSMIDNPKVYITTVGLYNDNSDLLAVAKLSQPIAKDFTKEALFRVKLDF